MTKKEYYTIKFRRLFDLKLSDYIDITGGLDAFAFDRRVKTPDGLSTYDHVVEIYGEDAQQFLKSLLYFNMYYDGNEEYVEELQQKLF